MQLKDNKCVDMDLDLRILLQWQQQFKCKMTWQQPQYGESERDADDAIVDWQWQNVHEIAATPPTPPKFHHLYMKVYVCIHTLHFSEQ